MRTDGCFTVFSSDELNYAVRSIASGMYGWLYSWVFGEHIMPFDIKFDFEVALFKKMEAML